MRRALVLVAVAACSKGPFHGADAARADAALHDTALADTAPVDAPRDVSAIDAPNGGFTPPAAPLTAWTGTNGSYSQIVADLGCLGAARADSPTTTAVTLTVTVRDFQSQNIVPSAQVAAYATFGSPFATATSDSAGTAVLTIPSGETRIGFDLTASTSHETLIVDQLLAPSTANQTATLHILSSSTVATLPALVGLTYVPGTALELGTIHDCQGANLANAIATVSSTPATATQLPGADTYYFSDSVDLPVHHNQQPATSRDGLFMVLGLPATTTAYVQVWGYRNANEQAAGTLTLIAQLAVPLPASAVAVTVQDPRAT